MSTEIKLAAVSGHAPLQMLKRDYPPPAENIASKLCDFAPGNHLPLLTLQAGRSKGEGVYSKFFTNS